MIKWRHLGCSFLTVLGIACRAPLLAQQPPPPPPPPHEGTAEFAFVGTTGNSSTQAIGLGADFILRREFWVYTSRAAYVRNETEDELSAESFAALFQAARTITGRLSSFGRYTFLRNTFAGVDSRQSIAGGLEYLLVQPEPHRLAVNAGIGYANEHRVVGDDLSNSEFLAGASYTWTISPTADLTNDFGFTMSFADAGDWRTANLVALTAELTTLFSLKVSNTVRYVNEPVEAFAKTDTITSVALVATF
jgi:putative salt-induced outer membrane protein